MIITKINTLDFCKTDRGVFEERDHFFLHHEKIAVFGQGKKVYFHLESGKNYPFSALLSGKKGVYFTKSQGKLFWGTAGNPVPPKYNSNCFISFSRVLMLFVEVRRWILVQEVQTTMVII